MNGLAGTKKKNRIEIREENRGAFTDYCKGLGYTGVTDECIRRGKKSQSKSVRKQATFAMNARSWGKGD